MPGEKDQLKDQEKAPPPKQPTEREGIENKDNSRDEHHMPGADGPLGAEAEEDTYD